MGGLFLPLLARIIKNGGESRRQQEEGAKQQRIGREKHRPLLVRLLRLFPSLTGIPAAYFENDWTRFLSRHLPVCISFSFFFSVHWNHASFVGRHSFNPVFSSFPLYPTPSFCNPDFPCHPSFSRRHFRSITERVRLHPPFPPRIYVLSPFHPSFLPPRSFTFSFLFHLEHLLSSLSLMHPLRE